MVGFIQEPIPHEEESGTKQEKFKTSKYPETFRLDFDEFSLSSIDSFLDLDFAPINEWINDVQAPEDVELSKFEIGCMDNLIGNSLELDNLVQDMNQSEKSVSIKAECVGSAEHIDCSMDKSDGYVMEDFVKKTELGSSEIAEINSDCHPGETKISLGDNERINDMQAPEDVQLSKSEIGSGVDDLVGNSLDNLVQGMNQSEKSVSAKVECIGSAELGSSETAEINSDGHHSETKISPGDGSVGLLDEKDCCKLENLNCSIEEELQKVNLGGDRHKSAVIDIKKEITPVLSKETASDSKSDNECDSASSSSASSSSSSTSSSSSSSSSGSDDDSENDDEEDNDNKYDESGEEFSFKDDVADGDSYMKKGAIRSQNEITVLPRVDEVNVTLLPHQEILPVGVISSVLGNQVIVEGSEKHTPLDDSSILWITETRLPLGRVDEIFGPVENPYYIVRYNSENDIPSDIQSGTLIGFVPEFVKYVLESEARKKGSDASGPNDEEVMDELEFSDDEEEAEFKRTLKTSKRGNSNQDPRPSGNKRKNNKSRNKTRTKDQPCTSHSPTKQPTQTSQMQQHAGPRVPSASESNQFGPTSIGSDFFGRPAVPSIAQGYQPGPSPMGPFFPRGPSLFPQQLQQAGFLVNAILQQQNMAMPVNSMPPAQWQQQHYFPQMPPTNPALFQQPYIGLQGPSSQFPITPSIPSNSFQAPSFQGNETVPPQFNQGFSSGRGGSGRGRGRTPFHRRGGRFGGGRGRHQAN